MEDHGNQLRLVISSCHLIDTSSLLRSIAHARKLGFWGVEIFGNEIVSGQLTDAGGLDEVRRTAEEHRITLTVHPWFDWTGLPEAEATSALEQLLERCHRLNAPYVNVHLNFLANPDQGVERAANIVRPLLGQLERMAMQLCFENVPSTLPNPLGAFPQEFATFFDLVEHHPRIGLTIDTGHAHMSGNLAEFTEVLASKWVYTHLADNHGEADEHLGSGMGTVDWDGFVQSLVSTSYYGPLIVEFNERYIPEAQEVLERLFQAQGREWPRLAV